MTDGQVFSIRPATAEDARAVSAIIVRTLQETNARDYPSAVIALNVANNTPEIIASRIANDAVFVAQMAGRVVGTASLNGDAVKGVFVEPEAQGRGIGQALMREIETLARAGAVLELRLQASITARGFYEKLGFSAVREVMFGEERTFVMLRALE